jgi:hypothetical protein
MPTPPEPRWSLQALRGGSQGGELIPPPRLTLSAEEYQRFSAEADAREAALSQAIAKEAGELPELAECRQAQQRLDGALDLLRRVEEGLTEAAGKSLFTAGTKDTGKKLADAARLKGDLLNQKAMIAEALPPLQRAFAAAAQALLTAVRMLAQRLTHEDRVAADAALRGWRRDETLADVLKRVGPAAVLFGRIAAPQWHELTAQTTTEQLIGPVPAVPPDPTPLTTPPQPFAGVVDKMPAKFSYQSLGAP